MSWKDFLPKPKYIEVPDEVPGGNANGSPENPNENNLAENRGREIAKVYGPARQHRFSMGNIAVVYGPAPMPEGLREDPGEADSGDDVEVISDPEADPLDSD